MSLSHESVGRQLADFQYYGIDHIGLVRSVWQGHDEYQVVARRAADREFPAVNVTRGGRVNAAVHRQEAMIKPTAYIETLVSWNFKHIVNPTTRSAIECVCRDAGFVPPIICTPDELIEA